jgi:dienelactone hydrolase
LFVSTAYLEAGRAHLSVHATQAAAIGYCFGGMAILEMVRGGLVFDAAVSFHGVLQVRFQPLSPSFPLRFPSFPLSLSEFW